MTVPHGADSGEGPQVGRQDPKQANKSRIADVARELMDDWNHGKTDPSLMAVNGHDTAPGYEFFIERDGRFFTVTVSLQDWE